LTEWDERSSSWLWALCPVRNDGVSVCASDTVWKELFELVAVFLARRLMVVGDGIETKLSP